MLVIAESQFGKLYPNHAAVYPQVVQVLYNTERTREACITCLTMNCKCL